MHERYDSAVVLSIDKSIFHVPYAKSSFVIVVIIILSIVSVVVLNTASLKTKPRDRICISASIRKDSTAAANQKKNKFSN